MRGSSFTFRPSDPARVGGWRATEEMKTRQKDEDPKMSDRDKGRGRRIEGERKDGKSWERQCRHLLDLRCNDRGTVIKISLHPVYCKKKTQQCRHSVSAKVC